MCWLKHEMTQLRCLKCTFGMVLLACIGRKACPTDDFILNYVDLCAYRLMSSVSGGCAMISASAGLMNVSRIWNCPSAPRSLRRR